MFSKSIFVGTKNITENFIVTTNLGPLNKTKTELKQKQISKDEIKSLSLSLELKTAEIVQKNQSIVNASQKFIQNQTPQCYYSLHSNNINSASIANAELGQKVKNLTFVIFLK